MPAPPPATRFVKGEAGFFCPGLLTLLADMFNTETPKRVKNARQRLDSIVRRARSQSRVSGLVSGKEESRVPSSRGGEDGGGYYFFLEQDNALGVVQKVKLRIEQIQ